MVQHWPNTRRSRTRGRPAVLDRGTGVLQVLHESFLPPLKAPLPPICLITLGIFLILKCTKLPHNSGSLHRLFLCRETSYLSLYNSSEENLSLTSGTRLDFLNMSKCMFNCLFLPIGCTLGALLITITSKH